jgi:lipopolysaccharide/colanic/teichoic acid biosynthesis glycosyltransferase
MFRKGKTNCIVKGITGWARVNGYRGETRNTEQMAKRVDYDIWYSEIGL